MQELSESDSSCKQATREALLDARARRQHGVLTRAQLLEDGFDDPGITRRVKSGRLRRYHRGVYVAGHTPLSTDGEHVAAAYACGTDAVVHALSGAVCFGLLRYPPKEIQILVPARGRRPRPFPGVALHQTRDLPNGDVTVHRGIPITTVPRILLDLAARADVSDRALESAAAQAERDGRLHPGAQQRLAQRSVGRPGGRRLRRILRAGPDLLLSEEEHKARDLLVAAGLPVPCVNAVIPSDIGPLMCDLWWPDFGCVLEVHGRQHDLHLNGARDIDRDGAHRRRGRRVDAVTARQVREEPAHVVAVAVAALRSRGWAG